MKTSYGGGMKFYANSFGHMTMAVMPTNGKTLFFMQINFGHMTMAVMPTNGKTL